MKKKRSLVDILFEDDRLLKEEEEDSGDDIFGDDSGDDDAGDEESDEGGDEESDEGGDEEEAGDEDEDTGDEDSEDSESDDAEDSTPAGPADDTMDGEINNLLADFEAEAIASAEQDESLQGESFIHKKPMSKLLFEADDPVFDVSNFTNNIARVIDNYQTLLDVEKMIFDKAKKYLTAKYGEVVADEFESILDADHQISFVTGAGSDSSTENEDSLPIAAGAMTPV